MTKLLRKLNLIKSNRWPDVESSLDKCLNLLIDFWLLVAHFICCVAWILVISWPRCRKGYLFHSKLLYNRVRNFINNPKSCYNIKYKQSMINIIRDRSYVSTNGGGTIVIQYWVSLDLALSRTNIGLESNRMVIIRSKLDGIQQIKVQWYLVNQRPMVSNTSKTDGIRKTNIQSSHGNW